MGDVISRQPPNVLNIGFGLFFHAGFGFSGTRLHHQKKGKKSALYFSKVKLGLKILKESDPQTVYFSTIIEDRVVYGLKIEEVCQDGDIIKVDFKKGNGKLQKWLEQPITLVTINRKILNSMIKKIGITQDRALQIKSTREILFSRGDSHNCRLRKEKLKLDRLYFQHI